MYVNMLDGEHRVNKYTSLGCVHGICTHALYSVLSTEAVHIEYLGF